MLVSTFVLPFLLHVASAQLNTLAKAAVRYSLDCFEHVGLTYSYIGTEVLWHSDRQPRIYRCGSRGSAFQYNRIRSSNAGQYTKSWSLRHLRCGRMDCG